MFRISIALSLALLAGCEPEAVDTDKDGLSEAAELYVNELVWMANCAP